MACQFIALSPFTGYVICPVMMYIAKKIPGARLETIAGAGHSSNLDQPEAFNRVLLGLPGLAPVQALTAPASAQGTRPVRRRGSSN